MLSSIQCNGQRHPAPGPAAGTACSQLGDAILAEPRCARTVVFVPQGHGKQKLIIPRMLEDKLRQKMGCGVYRTVHIAHDGAGRAEWMTASYEGRIGAVRVEASDAMDVAALVEAFIAACD